MNHFALFKCSHPTSSLIRQSPWVRRHMHVNRGTNLPVRNRLGQRNLRSNFREKRREIPVQAIEDIIPPQRVPLFRHEQVEFEGVSKKLTKQFISSILDQFARTEHIRELAAEQNINKNIFDKAFQSFRLYCSSDNEGYGRIDPALSVLFSDIQNQDQSVDSIYPYFLKHAHKVFPHLECIHELKKISDLTQPHNWYPTAREIHRKIFFHAGPTNSGKTYEALQAMKKAERGIYCGPLRLLAHEVYMRINKDGILCDMITGEQRLYASGDPQKPANHCTYTVEMLPTEERRNVCVIDEIQMLRDDIRGAAWTRALLGAPVDELHLCGEEAAYEIIQRLVDPIGEHVELIKYQRKNPLVVIDTHGLKNLAKIQDGDCIIHFGKKAILHTAQTIKRVSGRECAIVFGDLPPETKKEQIGRFNDPDDPCKVLLATDAVGMGMNLDIKRIIFTTLFNIHGGVLPAYFVKQIAGRAGRFASSYCTGEVMALKDDDSKLLGALMNEPIQPIDQAGIAPYYELIELFSMHLPHCTLVQLIDIFVSISTVNDNFFVCMPEQIRDMALLIEHIPLSLKDRYTFCLCPIGKQQKPFLNAAFVKMVRRYSQGNSITLEWVRLLVEPMMKKSNQMAGLDQLIEVYDFLYAYLWLSYRFEEYFPHRHEVRDLQTKCGELINESLKLMIEQNNAERMEPKMEPIIEKKKEVVLPKIETTKAKGAKDLSKMEKVLQKITDNNNAKREECLLPKRQKAMESEAPKMMPKIGNKRLKGFGGSFIHLLEMLKKK